MRDAHGKKRMPLDKKPESPDAEIPQWLKDQRNELSDMLETLNNQIASIPPDSSLKNLRAMMKETAKGLQKQLDELDDFMPVKQARHTLISSKKD